MAWLKYCPWGNELSGAGSLHWEYVHQYALLWTADSKQYPTICWLQLSISFISLVFTPYIDTVRRNVTRICILYCSSKSRNMTRWLLVAILCSNTHMQDNGDLPANKWFIRILCWERRTLFFLGSKLFFAYYATPSPGEARNWVEENESICSSPIHSMVLPFFFVTPPSFRCTAQPATAAHTVT